MSDDDLPRIVQASGGRSIVYGKKELYGPSSPEERAESRAQALKPTESTLYFLVSPLLWYGVERVLKTIPDSSHILAAEIDDNLRSIASEELPQRLRDHPRLHFFRDQPDPEKILTFLQSIGVEKFRSVTLVSLNGGYRLYSTAYGELKNTLSREIETFWKNKITLIHMAPLWIKNMFINLALYYRHLQCSLPKGADEGENAKAALVVGAGPSAENVLPFLALPGIRKNLYIIAVDTALSPLDAHGIVPDAVVVQEGQFYNIYDFLPVSFKNSHPALWIDLSSADIVPRLRRKPKNIPSGDCAFFLTIFFPTRLFDRMAQRNLLPHSVPPLGSVGITAVELALRFFTGPVLLTGLDFSFYYGKTHMRGAPLLLRELLISNRLAPPGSSPVLFPQKSVFRVRGSGFSADGDSASRTSSRYPELLTTGMLRTYNETFTRRFSDSADRLFLVGDLDTNSNFSRIRSTQLEQYLQEAFRRTGTTGTGTTGTGSIKMQSSVSGTEVKTFLQEEAELLRKLYDAGKRRLNGAEEAPPLEEIAKNTDYLFHHFPDTGYSPPAHISIPMTKRLLVSAGHYLKILEHALELFDSS